MSVSFGRYLLLTVGLILNANCLMQAEEPSPQQLTEWQQRNSTAQQQLDELNQTYSAPTNSGGVTYTVAGKTCHSDLIDTAVLFKGVEWMLRHKEFSSKATSQSLEQVLQLGEKKLQQLQAGQPTSYQPGVQICGYFSEVDHSLQPYALTLPADYSAEKQASQRYPLYVVLHGRGGMNEVAFITRNLKRTVKENQQWIQIDVFGRIDNAYRWAGETDVFEAMRDVSRRFRIDDRQVSLWGFSMGGAGAWHLGLHHPDRWASVGAGAGFIDFYEYQKQSRLPDWQHFPLSIYDSIGYARNLQNLPFVTYGGELDKQLVTSQRMLKAAEQEVVPLEFILGKQIGHKFTPEAEAEFQSFLWKHNQAGKPRFPGPKEIKFITYTPKYGRCFWLNVEELEELYQPATVESKYDAETATLFIETENIAILSLSRDVATDVCFDEEPPLPLVDAADNLLPNVYYEKREAGWEVLDYVESREYQESIGERKVKDLQGPIDDAFMQPFVCVLGTGTPWSRSHQLWVDGELERLQTEFDKWMRGRVRIFRDSEVTPELMRQNHLILFGDPGSNSVIRQIIDELPIDWEEKQYQVNGQSYPTDSHVVPLIYPNPLQPEKYVVLNSGMSMTAKDFQASNAWLFPKRGDIAVIRFDREQEKDEMVWGGLFNRFWELPAAEEAE